LRVSLEKAVVRTIDRAFGWLLVLGGLLHAVGSVKGLANRPDVLVWALSGSLAALLLAAINLMRVNRPDDRPLAWVSTAGSIAWGCVAVGFGVSIGNLLDPRAFVHAANAAALAGFSVRTALRAGPS
jgi:hypothetical protein